MPDACAAKMKCYLCVYVLCPVQDKCKPCPSNNACSERCTALAHFNMQLSMASCGTPNLRPFLRWPLMIHHRSIMACALCCEGRAATPLLQRTCEALAGQAGPWSEAPSSRRGLRAGTLATVATSSAALTPLDGEARSIAGDARLRQHSCCTTCAVCCSSQWRSRFTVGSAAGASSAA